MALRVAFTDFWAHYDPERELLLPRLRRHTDAVVVHPRDAEVLFYSDFGLRHVTFAGLKVHYTPENSRPPWGAADFCVGYERLDHPRYLRFPDFAHLMLIDRQDGLAAPTPPPWDARDFCVFLYSRTISPERGELFDAINEYRRVTSPGAFRRNTVAPELSARHSEHWRATKLAYQSRFRFTIACENSRYPGYTTEKLPDALTSGTIPIYWGDPTAHEDVRREAFIHADDFPDFAALTAYVAEVDRDPALAQRYLGVERWLVRPLDEYERALDEFLGTVAAAVGSVPRRVARRRAARLTAAAVATKAGRVPGRVRRSLRGGRPEDGADA